MHSMMVETKSEHVDRLQHANMVHRVRDQSSKLNITKNY